MKPNTLRLVRLSWMGAVTALLTACQAAPKPRAPRTEPSPTPPPTAATYPAAPTSNAPPAQEQVADPAPRRAEESAPPAPRPALPPAAFPKASFANNAQLALLIDPATLEGLKGVELWVTEDEGETWRSHAFYEGRPRQLRYMAGRDGRYGFKIVRVDRDGNRSEQPRRGTVPDYAVIVDTQPPLVTVEAPNGGDLFRAGSQTLISWSAIDPNLDENSILIEHTADDGRNWHVLAQSEANDGKFFWTLPMVTSKDCRVRIHAKDRAGNIGSGMSERTYTIDGLPPTVQITSVPRSATAKVELAYAASDLGGAGLQRVELWMTKDGGLSWTRAAVDEDAASPMPAIFLDGDYGLKLVGVDRVGNASETPVPGSEAPFRLAVDTVPPKIVLLNFRGGEIVAGGVPMNILYAVGDASLPAQPALIEFTADGGKTWSAVAKDAKAEGPVAWTPPASSSRSCALRVTSRDLFGHETVETSRPFAIDAFVPEAVLTGPATSRHARVELVYEIRNIGYVPVKRVDIWRTPDGGNTWERAASDLDLQPPYVITLPSDGRHGLTVTCVTELGETSGRRQPEPGRATIPQLTVHVDTTPPVVKLLSFDKRQALRGGAKETIRWQTQDESLDPSGLSLSYTINAGLSWIPIAERIDALKGELPWTVPGHDSAVFRIKAVVLDVLGNVGEVISSEDLLIDSHPPKGRLRGAGQGGLSAVKTREFPLPFSMEDVGPSGIQGVQIWSRQMDPVTDWELEQDLPVPVRPWANIKVIRDGRFGFFLALRDHAGNAMPAPRPQDPPHVEVLVDTVPPRVELRSPLGGPDMARLFAGQEIPILWEAGDDNFGGKPISLYYTTDGGVTWKEIASDLPNTGEFPWAIPGHASDRYSVRVAAYDRSGNRTEDTSPQFFRVELPSPTITIEDPPRQPIFTGGRVRFGWRMQEGELRPESARVEISESGDTWRTYQPLAVSGRSAAVVFNAPRDPGVWWLRVAGRDLHDLGVFSDPVPLTVVDNLRRPPKVALKNFQNGGIFAGGQRQLLFVDFSDPDDDLDESTVRVEFSDDGGRNYRAVADKELERQPNGYLWTLPSVTLEHCRVRVSISDSEGMRGEDRSGRDFGLDSSTPEALAVGPMEAVPGPIEIQWRCAARISKIHVYLSDASGESWQRGPTVVVPSPVVIQAASPGEYGVYLVGENEVGTMGVLPERGTKPQRVISVRPSDPVVVQLTGLWKAEDTQYLQGDKTVDVTWNCRTKDLPPTPVEIEATCNSDPPERITPEGGVPNTGKFAWNVRKMDKGNCTLRIVVRDAAGREGTDVSRSFLIDSTPPEVQIDIPSESAGQ